MYGKYSIHGAYGGNCCFLFLFTPLVMKWSYKNATNLRSLGPWGKKRPYEKHQSLWYTWELWGKVTFDVSILYPRDPITETEKSSLIVMEPKYLPFRRWLYIPIIIWQGDWIPIGHTQAYTDAWFYTPQDERLEHVQKWRFGSDHVPFQIWGL